MKTIIFALAVLSPAAFAQVNNVTIRDFNFRYTNPHGEGAATFFSRSLVGEEVKVSVDKVDKDFHLVASGSENQEFTFKDAPSFMVDAETMDVAGFNLNFTDKLTLSLANGNFNSKDDSLKLSGLNLDCNRAAASKEVMDQLINGCIQRMALKSSKFSSQSLDAGLLNTMEEAMKTVVKGDLGINSLDLKTTNGKYDLSAEVKSQISGKVKSNGDMSYDETAGKLTLKIKEVKFGILNITGKVFDELKKNESEKLKVKEPYVYYSVK